MAGAAVVFAIACVLPLTYMIAIALWAPAGPTSEANQILQLDARQWSLLQNSVVMGAGAAMLATVLGAPFRSISRPRARTLQVRVAPGVDCTPIAPTYVIALAWTYLATGRSRRPDGRTRPGVWLDLQRGWSSGSPGAHLLSHSDARVRDGAATD